jgi:methylisocitrate lyase
MLFKTPDSPPRRTLRGLLAEQDLIFAVGAWDGSSEHNIEAVRVISSRTTAAVIADMDAGFGNASHVYHATQAMETAGASAVALEDQVTPILACNWIAAGREVYDIEFATSKVRAAVDARCNPETIVIARTDSEGDEIYRRGEAYAAAGAELIMAIATSPDFDASCWKRLHEAAGVPLVMALMPGTWQEREFTPDVLPEIGVRLALIGIQPFNAAMAAVRRVYQQVKDGAPVPSLAEGAMTTEEFAEIIGLYEAIELERSYTGDFDTAAMEAGRIS